MAHHVSDAARIRVLTLMAVLLALSAVSAYANWWDETVGGVKASDLSGEARDAFFAMRNASDEVMRITDEGLKSSFKPAVFNILIKDASDKMNDASLAFNESEYNSTILFSMQATKLSHDAEAALKKYHATLLQTVFIIAGGVFALLIILPIGTYVYHRRRRRKEFSELQKEAARRDEERRALMRASQDEAAKRDEMHKALAQAAVEQRVLPPDQT